MRIHHFWAQNGPFAPNKCFFWKIINITLICLLAPFVVQNFKKILPADPELWGCAILGPKIAHFPKWEYFSENVLMSLVSFIHAYLHAKIKVRYLSIGEISTIKKYWNLIGREQFLTITREPDFSQACSFPRMLMNRKNFRFTLIPDLKSLFKKSS